jgi:hypothetical protein
MSVFKSLLVALFFMVCSSVVVAEDEGGLGGDEFRKTALEYDQLAAEYTSHGKEDVAKLYERMAEIKREAAKQADMNNWDYDWSEYEAIEKEINKLLHSKYAK